MLSARMSLGIAQTVFYVPAVPVAIFLFVKHCKKRPRMAWWPLIPLSLIRLAGGIITIILEKKIQDVGINAFLDNSSNIGLIIAAIVLLNVGAVPLLIASQGQIRIILMDNYSHNPWSDRIAVGLRMGALTAVALLAAGGGVSGDNASLGRALSLAGYITFAVTLAVIVSAELYFLTRKSELNPVSRKVLMTALLAAPFITIRVVYGILDVASSTYHNLDNIWNPLFGNLYAFCFMCLFAEYIALSLYVWLGFTMPRDRGVREVQQGDEGYLSK